jgi:hypothetical protein
MAGSTNGSPQNTPVHKKLVKRREQGTGNREQGTGEKKGTGNREQGTETT